MLKVDSEEKRKFYCKFLGIQENRGSLIQQAHVWKFGFLKKLLTFRRIMFL